MVIKFKYQLRIVASIDYLPYASCLVPHAFFPLMLLKL
jgi:hypothetical protein